MIQNKSGGSRRFIIQSRKRFRRKRTNALIDSSTSKEGAHFKADGIPKLTNTVILDPKPDQRALRYAFNHQKAGELSISFTKTC